MGILWQMCENIRLQIILKKWIICMISDDWWILNSCEANCCRGCGRPEIDYRPRNHCNHSVWGDGNTTAHHYMEQEPRRPHWKTQSKVSNNGTTTAENLQFFLLFCGNNTTLNCILYRWLEEPWELWELKWRIVEFTSVLPRIQQARIRLGLL